MIGPKAFLFGSIASLGKRFVLAWQWWRHTYTFNVAHRPLCERFKDGVLRFGRVHVCRSCTLLYVGGFVTGIVVFCLELQETITTPAFYTLFVSVLVLSYPPLYACFSRQAKDVVRCTTGSVLVLMIAFFATGHYWLGLLNVAVFAAAYHLNLREYKRWKLRACDGCPEMSRDEICSGYRRQADRIRAYETVVEERLMSEVMSDPAYRPCALDHHSPVQTATIPYPITSGADIGMRK